MKALVTGGGGFLGRYIVEQLASRGDSVTVFARGDYAELRQVGARLIRGDLQDLPAVQSACASIDVVFHVAARAGIWGAWESFYQPNVVGTQNVIAACRAQRVEKLVYTSSPSVVFDGTNNQPHDGSDESLPYPTHYENFYSQTKAMGEQMVVKANGPNLLTTSLRPHLIFGPRDPHLLPSLLDRARDGKLIQVGDGSNKVDITYVEDAARAHLLAADALQPGSPVAGSVYFISQDDPITLWPWINDLLTKLDIPPIKRRISLPAARAIGTMFEFIYRRFSIKGEPRLTRFLASELALSHYYDISQAKRDFGYQPQLTTAQALEKTLPFLQGLVH
ncbi:MAG: NAD-dependent epimerase/dehydratase family protein [Chloroflexi bacterium]|nr:NAD-dependent epimerase/dehydratase family protein [Chloroflexota bacterium]